MLQELVSRLRNTNSQDPLLLRWIDKYEEKVLDFFASEHCIMCDGFGHAAGMKCPTYQVILRIAEQLCSDDALTLFNESMKQEFKNYRKVEKAQLKRSMKINKEQKKAMKIQDKQYSESISDDARNQFEDEDEQK